MIFFEYDGIFSAEVIRRKFVRNPTEFLIGKGKEVDQRELLSIFDSTCCKIASPYCV